jgi:hypothetical protein
MIYFIEHDKAGNIVHACCDPKATIAPLMNRVVFNDLNGDPLKSATGVDLSPYNSELVDPLEIDETTYISLMTDGLINYTCDPTTQVITKKAAA